VFNVVVSCNSKLIEMGVMLQLNGCGFPKRCFEIYFLGLYFHMHLLHQFFRFNTEFKCLICIHILRSFV